MYVKFDGNKADILDVEKSALISKQSFTVDAGTHKSILFHNWFVPTLSGLIYWMDVCPNDANLLASCTSAKNIAVYDRRQSKKVRFLENHHSSETSSSSILMQINLGLF